MTQETRSCLINANRMKIEIPPGLKPSVNDARSGTAEEAAEKIETKCASGTKVPLAGQI
jgi:hypothetical protein